MILNVINVLENVHQFMRWKEQISPGTPIWNNLTLPPVFNDNTFKSLFQSGIMNFEHGSLLIQSITRKTWIIQGRFLLSSSIQKAYSITSTESG